DWHHCCDMAWAICDLQVLPVQSNNSLCVFVDMMMTLGSDCKGVYGSMVTLLQVEPLL
ncbi:MAG: microcystin-dependent protein, partial [Oceanospirillaceae bacterium]